MSWQIVLWHLLDCLLVFLLGLDLAGVLGEYMDVCSKCLHVFPGVFAFTLALIFISCPGSAFELHGQRDTEVSVLDELR